MFGARNTCTRGLSSNEQKSHKKKANGGEDDAVLWAVLCGVLFLLFSSSRSPTRKNMGAAPLPTKKAHARDVGEVCLVCGSPLRAGLVNVLALFLFFFFF